MTSVAGNSFAQDVPIVQPGAPGGAVRTLSAQEAIEIADTSYSPDDVLFMQNMIPHHAQAVEMAALAAGRTNLKEIVDVAGRIDASQADEIKFMKDWLNDRGERLKAMAGHGAHSGHHLMEGMATPEQIAELKNTKSTAFDRLFLTLMIEHHDGALKMVKHLTDQPGSAYDPVLFEFINDIKTDQTDEIERMNAVLVSLSSDPRAGLSAGYKNAGEAALNIELLAALDKPSGFFDPENPSGLPPKKPKKEDDKDKTSKKRGDDEQSLDDTEWSDRSPLLSFSNTDMAFSGDTLVAGSYHGFNVYKLQDDGTPKLYSSVVCPGGQGDVSIVDDLLIMSAEQTRGRVDCGLQGINEDVSADRFRGLRIFDISNLAQPVQVGQVQTCRGSHTHSVVTSDDNKIIVYNSGTSSVRKEEELAGCIGDIPGDDRTALFRIDVIEIPVSDPSKSRIVDSPAVFADPKTGRLAGLWQGGDHGDDTQKTRVTNQCHDITVFPAAKIAAGACSGNGIIFDISNPLKPKRIDEVVDKGFAYWHSATFNNDGTKVIFTDEWGGGSRPRCRAHDPRDWGANAVYDIVERKLEFKGYYKIPAPQADAENCVAHNGSVVPVPGRDIFAQAWYQGGLSVIDFTDSANPVEIAYFDRGPVHEERLLLAGYWSTYWYNGKIYGTEIARGLDVLALKPSDLLSENEIAAASLADQGDVFNPQQQFPVSWPDEPVVARAYLDQMQRANTLSGARIAEFTDALDLAAEKLAAGDSDGDLSKTLRTLASGLKADGNESALRETINGIARRLR
ncbi:MAG: DUF305 domain-containing protein [Acidimicrobiales bacterium]|nr:DUF305 domain-containing protein [Hyphomonadaceae bacterium]RZV42506.1 MAG: DUF305 domain-containing protein [Acidimicrobiales bacterium]